MATPANSARPRLRSTGDDGRVLVIKRDDNGQPPVVFSNSTKLSRTAFGARCWKRRGLRSRSNSSPVFTRI